LEFLFIPLESINSIFDMSDFPKLLNFLDYNIMKLIGLKIINNLINPNSKEKINSLENINKLFLFKKPLLKICKALRKKKTKIWKRTNAISKFLLVVKSLISEELLEIYIQLKNTLYEGGKNRRIIALPSLENALIYYSQQITLLYENKSKENNDKNSLYDLLTDIIKVLEEDFLKWQLISVY